MALVFGAYEGTVGEGSGSVREGDVDGGMGGASRRAAESARWGSGLYFVCEAVDWEREV